MRDGDEGAAGLGVDDGAPGSPLVGPIDGRETELIGTTDGLDGLIEGLEVGDCPLEGPPVEAGDCTLDGPPVEPAGPDRVEGLPVDPGG